MRERLRAAFVIGRRDFAATVFSRAFLLFLIGPLFPVAMGLLFGSVGGTIAEAAEHPLVAVVASAEDFRALEAARERIATALPNVALVRFQPIAPKDDLEAHRALLLKSNSPPILGVLDGGLRHPHYTGAVQPGRDTLAQLQLIVDGARTADTAPGARITAAVTQASTGATASHRALTAQAGQMILFLLTILLAGMLLSQLIEEKSNKVIEVLAAAVPVDSIFLGKLVAMLAMSLLGIAVWTAAGAGAVALFSDRGLAAIPPPAVGWPAFLSLIVAYFAMSYLLLGAVFLGIGAQASTVREVQTLSMPVTMAQVLVFGLAATAVGNPNGSIAMGAALFPLSSPYAMIARAAELPELWPHAIAIAWQLLWVALFLRVASRLFRSNVLKSGRPRWRRARSSA